MAVALPTATPCTAEEEPRRDGGEANEVEAETPKAAVGSGDGAEAVVVHKKGSWSKEEDEKLRKAVEEYGVKNWVRIEKFSGLVRPAKNCRLRWFNYLRPNLKKYPFTEEEERLILDLHSEYGNSWARIASKLPGRSDNEIKNFWHKRAKKCERENLPMYPTTKENMQGHTNVPNTSINIEGNAADHNCFPTNYPDHTLPQFQPSTPNLVNNAAYFPTDASTTPQSQFFSSPSSIVTSQSHQPSPTNHLSRPLPNTPTSQNQNQASQPTETTLSIPDHLRLGTSSLWQGCAGSNSFTPLRKPPILCSPLRRSSMSQLSPGGHSITGSAHSVANASACLPQDSSPQMQWSSAMESPLKLKLSPGTPAQYCVQMSTQTTDSPVALVSGFQLKSPTTGPPSPLKLRLSIPNSTVQLNSSTAPQSKPSSCSLELPLAQPMIVDTTIPLDSSPTVKGQQPPSIQFHQPETSGVNGCTQSDSNSEIMQELREAQARVRFLKKKLRQRRISNNTSLLEQSSRDEFLSSESPETTDLLRTEVPLHRDSSESTIKDWDLSNTSSRTRTFLGGNLRVNAQPKKSKKKDKVKRILRRRGDIVGISNTEGLQVKKARKENRENLEIGEYMRGSIDLEMAKHGETLESRISLEKSLQRGEYSPDDIYKSKSSETFQEQRHFIELLDHLNSHNNVNAPNSGSWDNKLCTFQGPADKCSNECSSIEGLPSERSTLLQADVFCERYRIEDTSSSQRHVPPIDALDPLCSQRSATTHVKPGDEGGQLSYLQLDKGGYFACSFGQEFSEHGFMGGNLAAKSMLCESDLLPQQNYTADLLDFSYLVSKSIMEQQSLGCEQFSLQTHSAESQLCESSFIQHKHHAADLLDSSFFTSKQITEQESPSGVQFSLQTSIGGTSQKTSKLCESAFPLHQTPAANLTDSRYLVGFERECPRDSGGQYCLQASVGLYEGGFKTECTSREETWKQESFVEGALADNLWPEGQMASQHQTLSINRFNSIINPMQSKNLNDESRSSHIADSGGGVLQQEQDHTNTMPEELSSLLEFFPTTIQTLEWCNIGSEIPEDKASDDMRLDLHMSSTSHPITTIADYI